MTKALEIATKNRDQNNIHLMQLKELFLVSLQERAIPFEVNGSMVETTGHILNLYFPFIDVETMLTLLDLANIYVSSGSACTAGSTTPSHVLALCMKMKIVQNIQLDLVLMNSQPNKI